MNIARQLTRMADRMPGQIAVAAPRRTRPQGRKDYQQVTFRQLDEDSQRIAAGLHQMGVRPGQRIVLMVRPGIDFISLTFALFKVGAVVVLIDPGMGREHLLRCLSDVQPDGFVAIPVVHLARWTYRKRFPASKVNVVVGPWWLEGVFPWLGASIRRLRQADAATLFASAIEADSPAAIIFTTGSTGPPKGVLYRHENFATQVQQLQEFYQIKIGEVDLPGFPLFALFNAAMGVTTVIPDMDPRRPAAVDPRRIVQAVHDWKVTQAFGSPAIWNVVGQHCYQHRITLPSLRRVLAAGAPVPPTVLRRMVDAMPPEADMHTPYGATESLPVASIAASEVLHSTAQQSAQGAGTCVGRRFSKITWQVIRIDDGPIAKIEEAQPVSRGEIGELIVKGPAVTREYVTRREINALAKIADGDDVWHRIGDVGYLDDDERFWFCGRKTHRLETANGRLFTIPCESIVNQHAAVFRSALVGLGSLGSQTPVMIVETWKHHCPCGRSDRERLRGELYDMMQASSLTDCIQRRHILFHRSLPVDIRHNAKIFREKLVPWAERQLSNEGDSK